ncbi:MAG TPA: hypothetical protein VMT20_10895 [Terriglobia bacterium]|nr:hypothetical protein [Terriglobia bacterium]
MTKKRFTVSLGALVLLFAFIFPLMHRALAKPAVPPSNHPNMDAALHSLQEARKHLEQAEPRSAAIATLLSSTSTRPFRKCTPLSATTRRQPAALWARKNNIEARA